MNLTQHIHRASKLLKYKGVILVCVFLISFSLDTFAAAGGGGMGLPMGGQAMGGPGIPINSGIIFLVIAGLLFGFKKMHDISKQKEGN